MIVATLPNGMIICRGVCPAPMPVVPRARVSPLPVSLMAPPKPRRPKTRMLYSDPIGPRRPVMMIVPPGSLLIDMSRLAPDTAPPVAGIEPDGGRITTARIIKTVCLQSGIERNEVLSSRRSRPVVTARHVVMWLAKRHTTLSLPQIGSALMDRDHTTVLHGVRKIGAMLDAGDPAVTDLVQRCEASLGVLHDPH